MAVLKGGLPRFMHRMGPGALDRAGFFDYPQRSIFTLRDRSGPVKQTLVSIWSSDGLTSVPQDGRYVTRIALMSSRHLLPSPWYYLGLGFPGFLAGDEGKVLTVLPCMGARLTALM